MTEAKDHPKSIRKVIISLCKKKYVKILTRNALHTSSMEQLDLLTFSIKNQSSSNMFRIVNGGPGLNIEHCRN